MATHKQMNKTTTGANAVIYVIVVLIGLVIVNVAATRFSRRVDFTEDKIYSLSPASKDLVRNLGDRMTVKAFISKKLPPHDEQTGRYVRDMLEEYARASDGKLDWQALTPDDDKVIQQEAEKLKVPKLNRTAATNDEFTIGANYLGIALQYQGNVESIPDIKGPEGLEFQISTLIKMMAVKKKKLLFASSEGELLPNGSPQQQQAHNGLTMVRQFLSDYQVDQVSLNDKLLPNDGDALIIAGPRSAITERGKFVIDQFLMKGHSVAFLIDGMIVEAPGGQQMPGNDQPQLGRKNDHGMDDLLEHYGFKIHDDVVMEPKLHAPGLVTIRGKQMLQSNPVFTVATQLNHANTITERLKGIIFPMASSVDQVAGKQPGFAVQALATSSADAWHQAGMFVFDPETPLKPQADKGPFTYAYAGKGKLTSFFAGKPHPNAKGEKIEPPLPNVSAPPSDEQVLESAEGEPRIVVVGDSGFASDEYLQLMQVYSSYQVDVIFTLAIFDWLCADESMSALRQKVVQARPLSVEGESTKRLMKYGNVVGVPLLFILFGILRWQLRNARRRSAKI